MPSELAAGFSMVTAIGPMKSEEEAEARRKFVHWVYTILAIAITVTLANALLGLIFMSAFAYID